MMVPAVEEAATALQVSFVMDGRAPLAAGGFLYSRNAFVDVYDREEFLAVPIPKIRDLLSQCIAIARRGPPKAERPIMTAGSGKITIGHGGSPIWRELKDFVKDRLNLDPDEYNRIQTAGLSRKERLQQMLGESAVAFLVLTAEDVQKDGSVRARENVVHEAGLFQGRLGFMKAIILLEEGCEPFSNIEGLDQIRFPPGHIAACFEKVREVLEREGLVRR